MSRLSPADLILAAHLDHGARDRLYAARRSGALLRLQQGVYVRSSVWGELSVASRHRARAMAVSLSRHDGLVFSHLTAAALWHLPHVGAWPSRPHVAGPPASGGRSTAAFIRHGSGVPESPESVDDLLVTSLARTAVECAATLPFAHAVVLADAALRRTAHPVDGLPRSHVSLDDLRREAAHVPVYQGSAKVQRVIDFADGRADRPGESLSRASMAVAGVTPPRIQVRLHGASGVAYTVDFWWPEFNTIGEFDGKVKYTDPEYLRGKNPADVLYDEKLREDDLRAAGRGFTRWPWATAVSPVLLRAHLARAGVR